MARRRTFKWSKNAREMVRQELSRSALAGDRIRLRDLTSALAQESGNPRDACLRFTRQMGVSQKRDYRAWTEKERAYLCSLWQSHSVAFIAADLNRPRPAIYAMLRRLGLRKNNKVKQIYASLADRIPGQTDATARAKLHAPGSAF